MTAYQRARKNLLAQYRSAKKAGVNLSGVSIPKIPQRPDAGSIRRLEKISREIHDRRMRVLNKARAAKRLEKIREKKKQLPPGALGETILKNFMTELGRYKASTHFPYYSDWFLSMKGAAAITLKIVFDGKIFELGKERVVRNIEKNAERLQVLFDRILYKYPEDGVDGESENNDIIEISGLISQ